MKDIKIYTTSWCPYCKAAKQFFKQNNWDFEEIDIEEQDISRKQLQKIGKGMSVPQIIVDGQPIGGYNDLMRLYG
ncbi:MAG: glutaredoxin family protein [Fidelibacterota bacterium]